MIDAVCIPAARCFRSISYKLDWSDYKTTPFSINRYWNMNASAGTLRHKGMCTWLTDPNPSHYRIFRPILHYMMVQNSPGQFTSLSCISRGSTLLLCGSAESMRVDKSKLRRTSQRGFRLNVRTVLQEDGSCHRVKGVVWWAAPCISMRVACQTVRVWQGHLLMLSGWAWLCTLTQNSKKYPKQRPLDHYTDIIRS